MENQNKCEGCFYFKVRDVDPETGKLAWRPFCLESGNPARCEQAAPTCIKSRPDLKNSTRWKNGTQLRMF